MPGEPAALPLWPPVLSQQHSHRFAIASRPRLSSWFQPCEALCLFSSCLWSPGPAELGAGMTRMSSRVPRGDLVALVVSRSSSPSLLGVLLAPCSLLSHKFPPFVLPQCCAWAPLLSPECSPLSHPTLCCHSQALPYTGSFLSSGWETQCPGRSWKRGFGLASAEGGKWQ